MRTAAAASLGYNLLYLLSLFVTIVCWLVLCVCNTVLSEFLCPLLRPQRFVVAGLVSHTCLSVRTFLCKFITVERRVLIRAASQQISAKQKQSAASERRSQHDDVRRPILKATTGSCSIMASLVNAVSPTIGDTWSPSVVIRFASSLHYTPWADKDVAFEDGFPWH